MTVLLHCQETFFCSAPPVCYTNWLINCAWWCVMPVKFQQLWFVTYLLMGLHHFSHNLLLCRCYHDLLELDPALKKSYWKRNSWPFILCPAPFIFTVSAFFPILDSDRVHENHLHLNFFVYITVLLWKCLCYRS